MLLWCSKGPELLPFNGHCPVTFFSPSLFRSSSIISSVVNMGNNSICSWSGQLGSGDLWRSWASQYPDWKLKWPKSCVVSLAADIDCAMRNFSTRGMLCHIPHQEKHDLISHRCKKHTEQISHQNPQSELLEVQHITLSRGNNSDLILKWSFSNTELLKYFQKDQKTFWVFFLFKSSYFGVVCNKRR